VRKEIQDFLYHREMVLALKDKLRFFVYCISIFKTLYYKPSPIILNRVWDFIFLQRWRVISDVVPMCLGVTGYERCHASKTDMDEKFCPY
jgi:hypothetical protein